MSAAACKESECGVRARALAPPSGQVKVTLDALNTPDIREALRKPNNSAFLDEAIAFEEQVITRFQSADRECAEVGNDLLKRLRGG